SSVDYVSPTYNYYVEEYINNEYEGKIIVEADIIQERNREPVSFSYIFTIEEFICDGQSAIKDYLFNSFVSGGVHIDTSLSIINNAITIARNVTSSLDYGPRKVLRFVYFLQSVPREVSVIESFLRETSFLNEENNQLEAAIQQSLEDVVVNFTPASSSTINSLIVEEYTGCICGCISCKNEQCVICLEDYAIGAKVTKLDCGHKFGYECIRKWLKTSHYCPICRYDLPM
ncbi:unnamed protein product, partial [Brassica oleracea]